MTTFWIAVAAMAVAAALFATFPLLFKRIPSVSPPAVGVLSSGAPHVRWLTALAVGLTVVVGSVVFYRAIGNPAAISPAPVAEPHGMGQQQVEAMIVKLVARLEKNPQDLEGWAMLGRAQTVLGKHKDASATYAKATMLFPNDAQLLADYADALAMAQGGRLSGDPEQLVARALSMDPGNFKALAMAGTIAFNKKDFAQAITHWQRLRDALPPESEFVQSIQANIAEANNQMRTQAKADQGANPVQLRATQTSAQAGQTSQ